MSPLAIAKKKEGPPGSPIKSSSGNEEIPSKVLEVQAILQ
jgi:hypothetical protein